MHTDYTRIKILFAYIKKQLYLPQKKLSPNSDGLIWNVMYITINEFSVCHSFLILNVSELYTVMSVDDNKIEEIFGDATVAIIQIGFFLINTFLILLFLEMIELNIFNISDNTKQNIEQRALYDKILVDSFNEGNSEDEIEETVPNEEQKKEE